MELTTFYVSGIMYRPKKIIKEVADFASMGDDLYLECDKKNKYDKYAVKVFFNDSWIGYVESDCSKDVTELIESNKTYKCSVLSVDSNWETRISDSGREIDYISSINMDAMITISD